MDDRRPHKWLHRRTFAYTLICLCVISMCFLSYAYRRYVTAVGWHILHGSTVEVAHRQLRLPLLWWADKDSEHYDTTLLFRARPSRATLAPEITVSPALSGSMSSSDQEELKSMQALVTGINRRASRGEAASLITIKTPTSTFYCRNQPIAVAGIVLSSQLFCNAAGIKYSFVYDGDLNDEKEAELILSTLR